MKEKRTRAKVAERKKPYCFTILPSTMDRVEKLAAKEYRSASAQVDIILREHFNK